MTDTGRRHLVRWTKFAGLSGWWECAKVEYRPDVLVLSDVTTARIGDHDLVALDHGRTRDMVIPWHVVRGPVEIVDCPAPETAIANDITQEVG